MNIYEIIFTHYSPKDSETGIKRLIVAENDEEVYNYIKEENHGMYNSWSEYEELTYDSEKDAFLYNDGSKSSKYFTDGTGNPESFKSRMLKLGGEVFDENVELEDLYYGATLYGWNLKIIGATDCEIETVNKLYGK